LREGHCFPFTAVVAGCPIYFLVDEEDELADRAEDHPDGRPGWPKVASLCIN
jgi:hypothetical protein